MAYKFQLGAAKLGGKVTAAGLDAGDADIDNVADIAVDSISADGNDIKMVVTDNRGAAFQISSSAAGPILFIDTSTGTERAFAPKGVAVDTDGDVLVRSNSGRMELHASGTVGALMEIGSAQIDVNKVIRMSGSQAVEFADNNHKLVKNGATMELFAAGAKRLTAKNGGVDVEGELHADTVDIANPSSLAGVGLARNGAALDLDLSELGAATPVASDSIAFIDANDSNSTKKGTIANLATAMANGANLGIGHNGSGQFSLRLDELNAGAIQTGDTLVFSDANDSGVNKKETIDDIATFFAGDGLQAASGEMSLDLKANSGLIISSAELAVDLDSDALQFASGKIDLKDSIAGARTFESNLTVNGTASIGGDLIVQGTTVTLDVATVGITGSFSFEGATADGNETTLGVIDPTAARTINLPNQSGTIPVLAAVSATQITATPEELNLLDSGAGSSVALASGDGLIMFDADDNNDAKKVLMSDISTFVGSTGRLKPGASTIVNSDVTISNEVTLVDTGAARSLTMPNITDADLGKVYIIKDVKGTGAATNNITVNDSAAGHLIDGETSLTLESDKVAISLIACKDGSTFFYSIY